MAKRYARLNWNSTTTYVSAENLNKMDKGIDDCDNAIEVLNEGLNTVNNNLDDKISHATEVISSTNANDFKGGVRFGYGDNIANHPYTSGFIVSMSHAWADAGIQIAYATDFGSAVLKPCLRSYLGNTYSPWTYFDGTIKTT